jgi:hypothetical protein
MPYRTMQDGQINFTGKIAEWLIDFEKWFSQDYGVGSKIPVGVYNYYLIINYGLLAKEKWSKGFFTKSKSKTIESMITKLPNGNIELKDSYEFLDYLAENLSREDRINWSEQLRNKFKNQFPKQ